MTEFSFLGELMIYEQVVRNPNFRTSTITNIMI